MAQEPVGVFVLLVPIAAGISILAVSAAGLWVEHPVAFANSGSRITNFDPSADDDPAETE